MIIDCGEYTAWSFQFRIWRGYVVTLQLHLVGWHLSASLVSISHRKSFLINLMWKAFLSNFECIHCVCCVHSICIIMPNTDTLVNINQIRRFYSHEMHWKKNIIREDERNCCCHGFSRWMIVPDYCLKKIWTCVRQFKLHICSNNMQLIFSIPLYINIIISIKR